MGKTVHDYIWDFLPYKMSENEEGERPVRLQSEEPAAEVLPPPPMVPSLLQHTVEKPHNPFGRQTQFSMLDSSD